MLWERVDNIYVRYLLTVGHEKSIEKLKIANNFFLFIDIIPNGIFLWNLMYFMTLILLLREEEAALPGAGEGLALDRREGAGLVRDADGPVLAVLNI